MDKSLQHRSQHGPELIQSFRACNLDCKCPELHEKQLAMGLESRIEKCIESLSIIVGQGFQDLRESIEELYKTDFALKGESPSRVPIMVVPRSPTRGKGRQACRSSKDESCKSSCALQPICTSQPQQGHQNQSSYKPLSEFSSAKKAPENSLIPQMNTSELSFDDLGMTAQNFSAEKSYDRFFEAIQNFRTATMEAPQRTSAEQSFDNLCVNVSKDFHALHQRIEEFREKFHALYWVTSGGVTCSDSI